MSRLVAWLRRNSKGWDDTYKPPVYHLADAIYNWKRL